MDWSVAIVVWIVCGIASLLIAQSRGATNVVTWFFVGVLLGPLGVIIAALGAKGTGRSDRVTIGAADEIQKLAALRDAGTITPSDFERQKVSLLANGPVAVKPPNRVNQVVYATIVIVLVALGIYMWANS